MPEWGPGRRVSEALGLWQLWLPREAMGNLQDAVSSLALKQSGTAEKSAHQNSVALASEGKVGHAPLPSSVVSSTSTTYW